MIQAGIWTIRGFACELSIVGKVEILPATVLGTFPALSTRDVTPPLVLNKTPGFGIGSYLNSPLLCSYLLLGKLFPLRVNAPLHKVGAMVVMSQHFMHTHRVLSALHRRAVHRWSVDDPAR